MRIDLPISFKVVVLEKESPQARCARLKTERGEDLFSESIKKKKREKIFLEKEKKEVNSLRNTICLSVVFMNPSPRSPTPRDYCSSR